MGGNESWVLDLNLDFHVFENEVQIIMDLIGKDSHLSSLSDIAACSGLEDRKQEDEGLWTMSVEC